MYIVVSQRRFKNWILSGIWRDSASAVGIKPYVVHLFNRQTPNLLIMLKLNILSLFAKTIVFIHQSSFISTVPYLVNQKRKVISVYVTHISENDISKLRQYVNLNVLFCVMNTSTYKRFLDHGFPSEKLVIVHGAVDRKIFHPSTVQERRTYVLISGECKGRKNPERVYSVIKANEEIEFLCEGPGWKEFFTNKGELPNLSLAEIPFRDKGEVMRGASLLLNLSKEEGGPFPVLEALASGTPIMSTDVGFVADVLPDRFGLIIGHDEPENKIREKILRMLSVKKNCFNQDLLLGKYTWLEHGKKLFRIFEQ